jgi:hypothetical protein
MTDAQGCRTSKVTESLVSGAWTITLSNRFVYDGWNLLAELNATNNGPATVQHRKSGQADVGLSPRLATAPFRKPSSWVRTVGMGDVLPCSQNFTVDNETPKRRAISICV